MDARQRKEHICRVVMENRDKSRKRRSRKVNFFYLGDKLYKVLLINRPRDLVYTYCFTDSAEKSLVWSHTKKKLQRALTSTEVGRLVNRTTDTVNNAIIFGHIPPPQKSFKFGGNPNRWIYRWSHKDIFNLHEYLLTVGNGRPRFDGIVVPWKMPTRAELTAMLKDDVVLYVKTKGGEYAPVWKEHTW